MIQSLEVRDFTLTYADATSADFSGQDYRLETDTCGWKVKKPDEEIALLEGTYDQDGNPSQTDTAGELTLASLMGPADFMKPLGDDVDVCAECRRSDGFTGAETLKNGVCTLTQEGYEALKEKLREQLGLAAENAVSDDLDAIKTLLNSLFVTDKESAETAATDLKNGLQTIFTEYGASSMSDFSTKIAEALDAAVQAAENTAAATAVSVAEDAAQALADAVAAAKAAKDAEAVAAAQTAGQALADAVAAAKAPFTGVHQVIVDEYNDIFGKELADIEAVFADIKSDDSSADPTTATTLSTLLSHFKSTISTKNGELGNLNTAIDNIETQLQGITGADTTKKINLVLGLKDQYDALKFEFKDRFATSNGDDGDDHQLDDLILKLDSDINDYQNTLFVTEKAAAEAATAAATALQEAKDARILKNDFAGMKELYDLEIGGCTSYN
jgi:hypothetical protein